MKEYPALERYKLLVKNLLNKGKSLIKMAYNTLIKLGSGSSPSPSAGSLLGRYTYVNKNVFTQIGTWTTLADVSGLNPGMIKNIYISSSSIPPERIAIRIFFDGSNIPSVGTDAGSGFIDSTAISLKNLFSADTFNPTYSSKIISCINSTGTSISGQLNLDMPYQNAFKIEIFNDSSNLGNSAIQVEYSEDNSLAGYHFNALPGGSLEVNSTGGNFVECPLLNVVSNTKEVALKFLKMNFIKSEGAGPLNFSEGKIRMYSGGPGLLLRQTYFAPTPSNLSYYNQQPGVTELYSSCGTPDFFLASQSFGGSLNTFSTDQSAVILNNSTRVVAHRFFDGPGVGVSTGVFVVTWTCGDQNANPESYLPGFYNIVGYYKKY